jgi:hypothetical protein
MRTRSSFANLCELWHRMCAKRCAPVAKRKLLVLAGAGAAIDFGMPSSACIQDLFLRLARDKFPLNGSAKEHLFNDGNLIQSLYSHMYCKLVQFWNAEGVTEKPNFEDALHVITQLGALPPEYSAKKFTPALGAFVTVCTFPEIGFGLNGCAVDSATWRSLAECLVYGMVEEFRKRCSSVGSDSISILKSFFNALASEFDIAVVTTNYDDLLHRALPTLEMGFDNSDNGVFKQERILCRTAWPCLLHLHGSVHFDGTPDVGRQVTRWNDNLSGSFYQDAGSKSTRYSNAGYASPASPIIVGYAKAEKIGELPYRTYYLELDRLIYQSEALLILGHSLGLGDTHLREAFSGYSEARRRNVVVIDYASGGLPETSTAARAKRVFRYDANYQTWLASHSDGRRIEELKAAQKFEVCTNQERRLSLWYNGMREACDNAQKVVAELKSKH